MVVADLSGRILLTSREAATMLAISERTLWDLRNRGEIPSVKRGRIVRFLREDLESWARKCVVGRRIKHVTEVA